MSTEVVCVYRTSRKTLVPFLQEHSFLKKTNVFGYLPRAQFQNKSAVTQYIHVSDSTVHVVSSVLSKSFLMTVVWFRGESQRHTGRFFHRCGPRSEQQQQLRAAELAALLRPELLLFCHTVRGGCATRRLRAGHRHGRQSDRHLPVNQHKVSESTISLHPKLKNFPLKHSHFSWFLFAVNLPLTSMEIFRPQGRCRPPRTGCFTWWPPTTASRPSRLPRPLPSPFRVRAPIRRWPAWIHRPRSARARIHCRRRVGWTMFSSGWPR